MYEITKRLYCERKCSHERKKPYSLNSIDPDQSIFMFTFYSDEDKSAQITIFIPTKTVKRLFDI